MFTLKSYVHNKGQPEGSIIEGYLVEECMIFMAKCLNGGETTLNRPRRNQKTLILRLMLDMIYLGTFLVHWALK